MISEIPCTCYVYRSQRCYCCSSHFHRRGTLTGFYSFKAIFASDIIVFISPLNLKGVLPRGDGYAFCAERQLLKDCGALAGSRRVVSAISGYYFGSLHSISVHRFEVAQALLLSAATS